MGKFGFNINDGTSIDNYEDRMIHIGGGEYRCAKDITPEWIERRKEWNESIEVELAFFKAGIEEE